MEKLYVATTQGLVVAVRGDDDWTARERALSGVHVTCVSARGEVVLAGTRDGLQRSDDGGATWRTAPGPGHVRWVAQHPDTPGRALAGTEPAGVWVSDDGGATWRTCDEVAALRDRFEWFLPYSPEAGCVRSFAFSGTRAYAAAEVGGLLCSDDGGATWRLVDGSTGQTDPVPGATINPDVHSVAVRTPDVVWAPTGGGLYRSDDGGATWRHVYDCYCRAVWLDPADAEHAVLGPANFVDRYGRIEETRDGGRTWQPASHGLETPWRRHMVERFAQSGDELLAVLSNGELLAAPVAGRGQAGRGQAPPLLAWRRVLAEVGEVLSAGC
jgi:photosystem II stability/assembly factor-like uncharacterized protein